jgi:hypothetical protein
MFKRKAFRMVISFIVFYLLAQIFLSGHIDIIDEETFNLFRVCSFLIFMGLIFICTFLLPKDISAQFGLLAIVLVIAVVGVYWAFLIIVEPYDNSRQDHRVLLFRKDNRNHMVIERVFYSGATGSDHYDTIKITKLNNGIRWINEVELDKLEQSKWTKVDP